jgi:hypothetical protein
VTQPNTGDLEKDLIVHLRSLWHWWRTSSAGETLRSLITEIQHESTALEEFRREFLPRRERTLRKIFARAVESGEIHEGVDVDTAVSMLTGMSWLHLVTADLENLDDIDNAVGIIVNGLRPR